MNRLVILGIVSIVLVGCVVFAYWDQWFGEGGPSRGEQEVSRPKDSLPAVDANRVHEIEISDSSGTVKLRRVGERWVLPEVFDAPVMEIRVKQLMDALQKTAKARPVARKASSHKTFEVDDEKGKRLKLLDDKGEIMLDLVVGKQDQPRGVGAGAAGTYVRKPGEDVVFRLRGRLAMALRSQKSWWLERRIMSDIDPKDVNDVVKKAEKITLEFADIDLNPKPGEEVPAVFTANAPRVRIVLERRKNEASEGEDEKVEVGPTPPSVAAAKEKDEAPFKWVMVEPADHASMDLYSPVVENIVRSVLYARLEDVVGKDAADPAYGLDEPVLDVTIHFEDGTSRNLKVGSVCEEKAEDDETPRRAYTVRYATASGNPYVVTVSQYTVGQLARKPDGFKKPELPGATPGGARKPGIALPGERKDEKKGASGEQPSTRPVKK